MSALRVATYNIHKGVQGLGLAKRLEIHNLAPAIQSLDADLVCLQEVRQFNRREARRFAHWPVQAQADFLAPPGYHAVYRTNAITRHGEHGNVHLGLIRRSRMLQLASLQHYIQTNLAPDAPLVLAGDFNEWRSGFAAGLNLVGLRAWPVPHATFPSRLPLVQLDHVFARGLVPQSLTVPRGSVWWRMSDHLPLLAEFSWPS